MSRKPNFTHTTGREKSFSVFLSSRKNDLVDAEKAIFNLLFVVNHLDYQEHYFREVKKDFFSWSLGPFIHFLPSTQPKMRIGRCQEIDDSGAPYSLQYHFLNPWILFLCLFSTENALVKGRENDISWKRLDVKHYFCLL
jgi:hypothetical protein